MTRDVVALTKKHQTERFDCGIAPLNTWLRTIAHQHQRKSLSGTFVLADESQPQVILGYYALNIRAMTPVEVLPVDMVEKLPLNVPALTIGRLAVAVSSQGQGLGELLLVDAMVRAKQVAQQVGGVFLFVDAKDNEVANFYLKYGFVPLPSTPLTLCMRIADIP